MPERSQLRVSGGLEGRSERPETGHREPEAGLGQLIPDVHTATDQTGTGAVCQRPVGVIFALPIHAWSGSGTFTEPSAF
jgi:hypothetical protein